MRGPRPWPIFSLAQLADPTCALCRTWDEERELRVTKTPLASIRLEFRRATWRAFDRQIQDRQTALEVAEELGVMVNAVLIAKSRVVMRLRGKVADLVEVF
jgi:RNA polymerase sigma-70 factor (ECF subfamily)